jgi:hypothetical protein
MANYVLVHKGGSMADTEEERARVMKAWEEWFGKLGPAMVDGGNPFGPSASVGSDGNIKEGASSGLTGYSILKADSLPQASQLAKGCPVLSSGGSIEVYETFNVM